MEELPVPSCVWGIKRARGALHGGFLGQRVQRRYARPVACVAAVQAVDAPVQSCSEVS